MSVVLILIGIGVAILAGLLLNVSANISEWEDEAWQFLIDAGSGTLLTGGTIAAIVAAAFIIIGFLNVFGIIRPRRR